MQQSPRPATEEATPDWRRLEVARGRFMQLIGSGIAEAMDEQTEVSDGTARCIAHVLGRAYGRASALANFGRTGEGTYLELRDEYLDLYGDEQADDLTNELIDWLGTYLVQRENTGSGRRFMNEHLPPKLDQLLVRDEVLVHERPFTVHFPASLKAADINQLRETLADLHLDQNEALQAFLSLPDVDAMSDDILEEFRDAYVATFESTEDAVHGLLEVDEWEKEVQEFAAERGLFFDSVTIDYEALLERARDAYDIVEWKDKVYAFYK